MPHQNENRESTEKLNTPTVIKKYGILCLDCTITLLAVCTVVASIFSASDLFPDILIDAKFYFTYGLAAVTGTIWASRTLLSSKVQTFPLAALLESTFWIVCTAEAIFFTLQKIGIILPYNKFGAGSFENVAGFSSCLSFSLLMGWETMEKWNKPIQWLFYVSKVICIITIIWAQSRTGMLCILTFLMQKYCPKHQQKRMFILLPLIIGGALFYKSDSSKGRWFILQRSHELACEHPWLGWGKNGFIAHYMDFQAAFFVRNPQNEYVMLADNIHHPLNEWIAVIVEYGIMGAAIITLFLAFTFLYALGHKNHKTHLGITTLGHIGIFALFSYPFQYPFTWLTLGFSLWCIYRNTLQRHTKIIALVCFCCTITFGYKITIDCQSNIELAQIQDKIHYGLAPKMIPRYQRLYPKMKDDSRFLFYYATALYLSERYPEALKEARRCKSLFADYELNLFLGDIFREMKQKDSTLYYYTHAHNMCPSRLTPLYEIYRTHQMYGDTIECQKLRKIILEKPIKVKSEETEQIIQEIK